MSDNGTDKLGVCIVGCGTVGGATATILTRDRDVLSDRLGDLLELRSIVDVNFDHARQLALPEELFCDDLQKALDDPAINVVAELVGGTTVAKEIIEKAVDAGKHVVTANKALLAHHGPELYARARRSGVSIAFEASCAGGIPIIRALGEGLLANRIDAMYGIVNGTCNYILTEMTEEGSSYADVLADAQQQGLAEADPTLDVGGGDSAHKLAIMASLAFGQKVDFDAIPVSGIDALKLVDVNYGSELGFVLKLLAIATRQRDGLSLRVRPVFIAMEHPLAPISGPFNAVSVYGHAVGHTMYYGRGAGDFPTASAVVADLAAIAVGTWPVLFEKLKLWPDRTQQARQLPETDIVSRYYLRAMVEDEPGVLGKIASILGNHGISICSVLQHEPQQHDPDSVPVIITTYRGKEGSIRHALGEIDSLSCMKQTSVCIPIVDEHPEWTETTMP